MQIRILKRERKEKGKPRRRARNERAERASISTKPKRAPWERGRLDAQVSGKVMRVGTKKQ